MRMFRWDSAGQLATRSPWREGLVTQLTKMAPYGKAKHDAQVEPVVTYGGKTKRDKTLSGSLVCGLCA
jgi:hypothetical protein